MGVFKGKFTLSSVQEETFPGKESYQYKYNPGKSPLTYNYGVNEELSWVCPKTFEFNLKVIPRWLWVIPGMCPLDIIEPLIFLCWFYEAHNRSVPLMNKENSHKQFKKMLKSKKINMILRWWINRKVKKSMRGIWKNV